ncbi:hypothetical protein ACFVAJ_17525 [Agromyces sp. NPDC057679]|uniref:hypothetical protein n=1 Tax=Agromyces sp. NPDC057679 TaxID=3346207 RepID=UPI00366B0ABA
MSLQVAACAAPRYAQKSFVTPSLEELTARLRQSVYTVADQITDVDVFPFASLEERFGWDVDDWSREQKLDAADWVIDALIDWIRDETTAGKDDVAYLEIDGKPHLATGGIAGAEPPTESYPFIVALDRISAFTEPFEKPRGVL